MHTMGRYLRSAVLLGLLGLAAAWAVLKRLTKPSVNQDNTSPQVQPGDRGHESHVTRPSSSVETIVFFTVALVGYLLLSYGDGDSSLSETRQWFVWRVVAALGIALAYVMAYRAVWTSLNLPLVMRKALSVPLVIGYFSAAVALVGGAFAFLLLSISGREWPIPAMNARLVGVALAVGLTAVPWIYITLVAHRSLVRWPPSKPIGEVLELWDILMSCVTGFAVLVVVALVPTGALRSVWLAQDPLTEALEAQFPASDVLLYGAFFAVIISALMVPVLASWRHKGREIVSRTHPLRNTGDLTEEWQSARSRLEAVLHLDVGILRNPLTAFALFTPLITSVLAGFIPELAN